MRCILCNGDTRHLFTSRDKLRPSDIRDYEVHWCDACALGRIAGDFTPLQVGQFYDVDYYTHGGPPTGTEMPRLPQKIAIHLAWRADRGSDFTASDLGNIGTVCDIGCGSGSRLAALKESGNRVQGVEPDPKAREIASKICTVHDGTAELLPNDISKHSFDAVIMMHVLEHCIDPIAAVSNVKSILKDCGKFIMEVPNHAATGFWTYKGEWPWSDIPRHLNFFTEKSLRKLLMACGFTIEKTNYTGYCRQFLPGWPWSFLLLATTAFAKPSKKYDSIRFTATPDYKSPLQTKRDIGHPPLS
jgi:SAM-dependent methyltransferase